MEQKQRYKENIGDSRHFQTEIYTSQLDEDHIDEEIELALNSMKDKNTAAENDNITKT